MATTYRAPDPVQSTFFIPGSNTPGNGVQVFFYVAGSSTKSTVYKDNAASTAWSNPIVLDSGGNLPSGGSVWLAASVVYDVVYAPSNDTDPPTSPYLTVEDVSGINDVADVSGTQWVTGPAPVFVGTTRLVLSGDQTSDAHIGRRIRTTNTGGTVYSTISSSVYTSTTALGLRNDSGSLDSGLSALDYGLLTAINPSAPFLSDFYPIRSSSSDATKNFSIYTGPAASSTTIVETIPSYSFKTATQNRGANVSSLSTTNVSTATGDLIDIYHSTAIDQMTMFDGQIITCRFVSTTPLNNSTTFVLLPGVNMTSQVGDYATFRGYTPPLVRMIDYYRVGFDGLGASRAWANVGAAGTSGAFFNVDSIIDNGVGNVTVVWENSFNSTSYACLVSALQNVVAAGDPTSTFAQGVVTSTFAASSAQFKNAQTGSGNARDPDAWFIAAFGNR